MKSKNSFDHYWDTSFYTLLQNKNLMLLFFISIYFSVPFWHVVVKRGKTAAFIIKESMQYCNSSLWQSYFSFNAAILIPTYCGSKEYLGIFHYTRWMHQYTYTANYATQDHLQHMRRSDLYCRYCCLYRKNTEQASRSCQCCRSCCDMTIVPETWEREGTRRVALAARCILEPPSAETESFSYSAMESLRSADQRKQSPSSSSCSTTK